MLKQLLLMTTLSCTMLSAMEMNENDEDINVIRQKLVEEFERDELPTIEKDSIELLEQYIASEYQNSLKFKKMNPNHDEDKWLNDALNRFAKGYENRLGKALSDKIENRYGRHRDGYYYEDTKVFFAIMNGLELNQDHRLIHKQRGIEILAKIRQANEQQPSSL